MAHFAKLDNANIVTQVIVVDNSVITNEDGVEVEQLGVDFLESLYNHRIWKQTSYSGSFRTHFAGVGWKYDGTLDAFIPPKPFESWTLNQTTHVWEAPVAYPTDGNVHVWDEPNQQWVEHIVIT